MSHRGPFQPLLFCDSVIQGQRLKFNIAMQAWRMVRPLKPLHMGWKEEPDIVFMKLVGKFWREGWMGLYRVPA